MSKKFHKHCNNFLLIWQNREGTYNITKGGGFTSWKNNIWMGVGSDAGKLKLGWIPKCQISSELQASDGSASTFIYNETTFQDSNNDEL